MTTAAHTWRVALYARTMVEASGFDHAMVERVTQAAALHDVGKLDIPDAILQKPGPLTDEEFAIIQTHADLGHKRLLSLGVTDDVALNLVRHHHERWDGRGYPDRLAGDAIPFGARYFAVIDAFDAMTSLRPYRREVGEAAAEKALIELKNGAGTRYFPQAVELFEWLYREGRLTWILHHFNDARAGDLPGFNGAAATTAPADAPPAPPAPTPTPNPQ